jgi:hydroxysqualene dehydroxylase
VPLVRNLSDMTCRGRLIAERLEKCVSYPQIGFHLVTMSTESTYPGSKKPPSVVVLGGGLAGIAAAVRLADKGCSVTLVESNTQLGGRATSIVDPQTGISLDNNQHVLMGCCTNLLDLYRRLDVADHIEWHRRLNFIHVGKKTGWASVFSGLGGGVDSDAEGETLRPTVDVLEADDLAAPLHMTRSLMAFSSLKMSEKLAISRGMLAMMRIGRAKRSQYHQVSFGQWLLDQGQPRGAIEKFWEPVVASALNEHSDLTAADYAMQVFQEGFLSSADAYVMGLSKVPLMRLYDAAERVIESAGGQIRLGLRGDRLHFVKGELLTLELSHGEQLVADAFICALPFDRLAKLCSSDMYKADVRLRRLDRFSPSPTLGIHLWIACDGDQVVMDLPHMVLTGSSLHWVFNKGNKIDEVATEKVASTGADDSNDNDNGGGRGDAATGLQHLHCVVSAAYDFLDMNDDELVAMAVDELQKALRPGKQLKVVASRVVMEKQATFSPRPGIDAARPMATGAIGNLYLAGDWTRTGWPATMEGGVRSGYLSAAAVLRDAGIGDAAEELVADLSPDAVYRLIGG